jgi:hypothetical protein
VVPQVFNFDPFLIRKNPHEFHPAQVDHEERPWQTFHGESAVYVDMEVCLEMGSLKSSNILVGFSIISHPFWDILGYLHFRKQPGLAICLDMF